jgi:putative Mg2+ transporter-C (MgtC) family protein
MDVLWQELRGGVQDAELVIRIIVRLLVAAILGGVLGIERQYEHKAAGMRTHMLVAIASALFVAPSMLHGVGAEHVTRIIQGVATGIGFVGGGTILKLTDQHEIRGLTTAANIWLAAAVGVAAGAGWLVPAVLGTGLALVTLYFLGHLERWLHMPGGR